MLKKVELGLVCHMEKLLGFGIEDFVRFRIEVQGKTHANVSEELMHLYPNLNGLSVMSVRRFCDRYNIHKTR